MLLTNDGLEVILRALSFGKIDSEFVNDAIVIPRYGESGELMLERAISGMRYQARLR